ncbi:MAG TPA: ferredoxin reductase, partial [Mycobacterium sp.]|nr:ferredoxin reductase [Mycobacterium sp.]
MSKKQLSSTANVRDTKRSTVAGADRHPGWHTLRRIVTQITTPLLPDDYLRLANPLWSARELRGRVLEVRRETADSATLVIKPGWGFHFDYRAGQYIGIGLLVDGRWRWRSYSLTSSPVSGARTIAITVKAMPEGFLSSHLVDGVAPGTIVRLAAPQGEFVLPEPAPATMLFLTAGSGITPVMSMLRTLARRGAITDVVHLHSAPSATDSLFADELAALQHDHPGYRLRLRATRTEGRLDLGGPRGFEALDGEVPDWRGRQTWACGPTALLGDAERIWAAAGIAERLHIERFAV